MARIRATASAVLDASPGAVYATIADYHGGHRAILPERWFSDLEVERGGTGEGTIIRFALRTAGSTRQVRAAITEPEPGRVLLETDLETGAVTRFAVEPAQGGSRVTIETTWSTPGLRGWIERLLAPRMLEPIYVEELRNLASVARERATAASVRL